MTISQPHKAIINALVAKAEKDIKAATGHSVNIAVFHNHGTPMVTSATRQQWAQLKTAITDYYGVKWQQVAGPDRSNAVKIARFTYCYIGYKILKGKSQKDIGEELGGRDHTTIIHAVKKYQAWINKDTHSIRLHHKAITGMLNLKPAI